MTDPEADDSTSTSIGLSLRYYTRRVRHNQRWSQEELARRLTEAGLPTARANVGIRERRNSPVGVDEAVALAAILGLPGVDALIEAAAGESCQRCQGAPPPGFACTLCGAGGQ
jgi:transcriptional regulator with XRE-family HTH domain